MDADLANTNADAFAETQRLYGDTAKLNGTDITAEFGERRIEESFKDGGVNTTEVVDVLISKTDWAAAKGNRKDRIEYQGESYVVTGWVNHPAMFSHVTVTCKTPQA